MANGVAKAATEQKHDTRCFTRIRKYIIEEELMKRTQSRNEAEGRIEGKHKGKKIL